MIDEIELSRMAMSFENGSSEEDLKRDFPRLLGEVLNLRAAVLDYETRISEKLSVIEQDMERLDAENRRLIAVKESAYLERDFCVSLIARLAQASGLKVRVAQVPNTAAAATSEWIYLLSVDLPSGTATWEFQESEVHLLEGMPLSEAPIEPQDVEERYGRVMNPGL